jgi:hypothetical protein
VSKKMTLTMEFERDIPDDRRDLLLTVNAQVLSSVIVSIDEHLRGRTKYSPLGEEAIAELHAVRDHIRAELGDLVEAVFG